mmetsp:Transcript_20697/g.30707  ORF Transcript_20697/g.30707 Transcript_20697/m.30707 type:complete len:202 (+) Transcript_20697:230-835(+)
MPNWSHLSVKRKDVGRSLSWRCRSRHSICLSYCGRGTLTLKWKRVRVTRHVSCIRDCWRRPGMSKCGSRLLNLRVQRLARGRLKLGAFSKRHTEGYGTRKMNVFFYLTHGESLKRPRVMPLAYRRLKAKCHVVSSGSACEPTRTEPNWDGKSTSTITFPTIKMHPLATSRFSRWQPNGRSNRLQWTRMIVMTTATMSRAAR